MIIIFIPNSGHSAVISGILHDSQESIIFNVEIVLVIVEELVFLDALHLHAFKVEVTCCRILLVCVEWVKSHAVDQRTRLVHLLFAAEKVHSQQSFSFLNLAPYAVNRVFQNLEVVDSTIKVHNFATHSNEHSSQENPHFFLHLLSLHQRSMKIYLFKFKPSFITFNR